MTDVEDDAVDNAIERLVERAASDRLHEEAEPVRLSSTGEGSVLIGGSSGPDPIEVQRRSEGHSEPTLGNSGGA